MKWILISLAVLAVVFLLWMSFLLCTTTSIKRGHWGAVCGVAFSPDGSTLVTGADDGRLILWSAQGRYLKTLMDNRHMITCVAYSPKGGLVAATDYDYALLLVSDNGKGARRLVEHTGTAQAVAFSPDGRTIATASFDKSLVLWNTDGEVLKTIHAETEGENTGFSSVGFSADGEKLIAGADDGELFVYDKNGGLLKKVKEHEGAVLSLAWSRAGGFFATGGADGALILWNPQAEAASHFKDGDTAIVSVAVSPDGTKIATGNAKNEIVLRDRSGKVLWRVENFVMESSKSDQVNRVAFSPDGKRLAVTSTALVRLLDLEGKETAKLEGTSGLAFESPITKLKNAFKI